MPVRSKRPCSIAGCPNLTNERWCEQHRKNKHIARSYDDRRGTRSERGYDADWLRLRLEALRRDDYLCQECLKTGRPTQATEVHHIIGIDISPELRLAIDNLESVCGPCHKILTIQDQGIFGRAPTKPTGISVDYKPVTPLLRELHT